MSAEAFISLPAMDLGVPILSQPLFPMIGYFAIRRGRFGLRGCIFLRWEDCSFFVDTDSEYSTFSTMEEAKNYLETMSRTTTATGVPMVGLEAVNTANPSAFGVAVVEGQSKPTESHRHHHHATDDIGQNSPAEKQLHAPTQRAILEEEQTKSKDGANEPQETLKRMRQQPSTPSPPPNKKHKNSPWDRMFFRLKMFHQEHGHWNIPMEGDTEALAKWVEAQRRFYGNFQDKGKNDKWNMAETKIARLNEIGFDFCYTVWQDLFDEAKEFLTENGHLKVPKGQNEALRRWLKRQMVDLSNSDNGNGATATLTRGQLEQLQNLKELTKQMKEEEEFKGMFEKLKQYKKEHGHCNVPSTSASLADKRLNRWSVKMRLSYRRLKETGESTLTVTNMQKLSELGFVFVPKGKQPTWEERIEALKVFKSKHGHIRIPKSYNEDGIGMADWVARQRRHRRLLLDGKHTALTVEKIRQLTEMGMLWEVGKRLPPTRDRKKTWMERYEELLEFKRKHGHTIVPQATPGLGEWVRSQRVEYRKLQQKKRSSMTAEKVMKLVEAGFVFDASRNRGKPTTTLQPYF